MRLLGIVALIGISPALVMGVLFLMDAMGIMQIGANIGGRKFSVDFIPVYDWIHKNKDPLTVFGGVTVFAYVCLLVSKNKGSKV